MTGTVSGGRFAAQSNKARHGQDFYVEMGRRGGKAGHTGGFHNNPEAAKIAGQKGWLKRLETMERCLTCNILMISHKVKSKHIRLDHKLSNE